ncbi:MAG: YfiR family protein [Desulfobacteraceae bacterium]|nr:YfiR family protein [Desulfobacteraceae bacterium]
MLYVPTSAYPQLSDEVLKAAWLERFSRFVEWPEESGINDVSKPFVITVIGKNPFGKVLNQLYSTRKIKKWRSGIYPNLTRSAAVIFCLSQAR